MTCVKSFIVCSYLVGSSLPSQRQSLSSATTTKLAPSLKKSIPSLMETTISALACRSRTASANKTKTTTTMKTTTSKPASPRRTPQMKNAAEIRSSTPKKSSNDAVGVRNIPSPRNNKKSGRSGGGGGDGGRGAKTDEQRRFSQAAAEAKKAPMKFGSSFSRPSSRTSAARYPALR